MKAIRVSSTGGPEALKLTDVETPQPGKGQALVRLEAIGVNFIDVYHRTGLYKLPLPFTPGSEGAGIVEKVGEGVSDVKAGDRVAYAMERGAYAEYHLVSAERLVPVPRNVDAKTAAAVMLQGMTAHYLACSTYPLKNGDRCLVHAAAGGTGGLLVQIAKIRGAHVTGTAGNDSKVRMALDLGADEMIDYTKQDFEQEVMAATSNAGVNVVYDSVGQSTFDKSLNCVGRRGLLALFGQSSGPVPSFDPSRLAAKGTFLTRPSLAHYVVTRDELLGRAHDIFDWISTGRLRVRIDRELPLEQAAEAHKLLEGRKTTGKLLLIP